MSLANRNPRPIASWSIFPRIKDNLFYLRFVNLMGMDVGQLGFRVDVEPKFHKC